MVAVSKELRTLHMGAGGVGYYLKALCFQQVTEVFWCCWDSSDVLLWDVVYSCSSRRCVCGFMLACLFQAHWSLSLALPGLEAGVGQKDWRGVVVVDVDPWGLKSRLHLTSNLPPPPLAVTHTNTHALTHTNTNTHMQNLKYYSLACTGRHIANAQISAPTYT